MHRTRLILSALAPALLVSGAWRAEAAPLRNIITPHRAVYDINLSRSEQGSGVSSASGRMVFEVTGNACEGYRMRQRMMVSIGDEDGNLGVLDFKVSTFESGDGNVYNFDTTTRMNEEVVEAVEGEARREGAKIEVSLTEPTTKTVTLDSGVLFPSQHLQAIIEAAQSDLKFVAVDIYEGAGSGDTSDVASAAIGDDLPPISDVPLRGGVRHWPVTVGYFDQANAGREDGLGEELPSYQMSFTLFENGVTSDLIMDYGDYALSGSLKEIEPLASADCSASR